MRWCATVAALVLSLALPAFPTGEVDFCSEWKQFDDATKADFIVAQSQAYLTQWKPTHWVKVEGCFKRQAPNWVYRIDEACRVENPMNFDVGLTMGALVSTMLAQCSDELRTD